MPFSTGVYRQRDGQIARIFILEDVGLTGIGKDTAGHDLPWHWRRDGHTLWCSSRLESPMDLVERIGDLEAAGEGAATA